MPDRFEVDWGVAEAMRDFQNLSGVLGSSNETTSSLSLLGSAIGVSDIRGAAEALHRATISGGLGTATAARYGLEIRPNEIGGATDRGMMLIRALEGLRETRRTRGDSAALADARNLDLDDWIGLVRIQDELFEKIKAQAIAQAEMYTPERIAAATAFNTEMAILASSFESLKLTLTPVVAYLNSWVQAITKIIRFATTGEWTNGPAQRTLPDAMKSLQSAVQENTSTLRQTAGMWGGGARFRGAIPAAFGPGRGHQIDDNLRALAQGVDAQSVKF